MRSTTLFLFLLVLLLPAVAFAGDDDGAALRQLFLDYNSAIERGDRVALDGLFLPDYAWVHSVGSVATRGQHLDRALANSPRTGARVPDASEFAVHGDVALLRVPARDGIYATTVFVRDEGRWRFAHAQGTRLPVERKRVAVDTETLERYVGSYEFAPGRVATVTRNGDALVWKGGTRPPVTLLPFAADSFYGEESQAEMMFAADASGAVTSVTMRLGSCQDSSATRVR